MIGSIIFPTSSKGVILRDSVAVGVGAYLASQIAKTVKCTALASNPMSGLVFCAALSIIEDVISTNALRFISSKININYEQNEAMYYSIDKGIWNVCKVATVAFTLFAISSVAPQYSLKPLTAVFTFVAASGLVSCFDAVVGRAYLYHKSNTNLCSVLD